MSVNMDMDMSGGDTDYTDFEVQTVAQPVGWKGQGNSANALLEHSVEPLADRGGLESDEAAELVATRTLVVTGVESPGNNQSNQKPGRFNVRGTFGFNLNGADEFVGGSEIESQASVLETLDGADGGALNAPTLSLSEPGIVDFYEVSEAVQFVDTTNGPGGGGSAVNYDSGVIDHRQLYGRGPIVYATDEWNHVQRLVNERNEYDMEVSTLQMLIWDVSTVDSQRKQFAVP